MKPLFFATSLLLVAGCAAVPPPRVVNTDTLGALGRIQFQATDGGLRSIADFEGRVVLVEFWATWCEPCTEALSFYDSWQQILGPDRFRVLAVSIDDEGAPVDAVLKQVAPHVALLRDPGGEQARRFGLGTVPTSVLLDPSGRVVVQRTGYGREEIEALRAAINRLMNESPG